VAHHGHRDACGYPNRASKQYKGDLFDTENKTNASELPIETVAKYPR
jgi:hypothetical protein